jgi:hypothetical protein
MEAYRNRHSTGHVAPSIGNTSAPTREGSMTTTSPSGGRKKLRRRLPGKKGNLHKLTVKSKNSQPAEAVKKMLKSSMDPIDMKIGIRTLKGLKDGNVLTEVDIKDDIEKLMLCIRDKCGYRLETIRKPGKEKSTEVSKFRPISLINVGGKVLEKLLINRIMHHIHGNGLMNPNQFGFTPRKSAVIAVKE